ncbi:MAG: TatD family hydrolase [Candidatus Margulisbacteria bacterium]|nr:TatD family hydrolase [Candidatus Margulisiibacteriota bacterium]MBU1617542.1 TatD family hydrolase [Candidatus Margulisiibacteriota bacterium]
MFIDTHAHLTYPEFDLDLNGVIARAKEARLEAIVNIALDEEARRKARSIAAKYPGYIFTAVGIHPHEASTWTKQTEADLRLYMKENKVVGLGEMGLDCHYKLSPLEKQQEVFRRQLQMAQELDLPAIIHSREAAEDTINIIREENRNLKGVLHCFAGDPELEQAALEAGLYISYTANITYPKAIIIRESASRVPLERILIETDCPFLAPQIFRGQRNEPSYVIKVAEKIAELKGLTPEEVAISTTRSAKQLFSV